VEFLKIVALCIIASVVYGIVHDQVTARICVEYFTVFHPPVFATHSPTLLGLGWGVIATWWAGAIIGLLLACSARFRKRNQISARQLVRPVCWLMGFMAICAVAFGILGYFRGIIPEWLYVDLPPQKHQPFMADWWAHTASYGSGFLGGLVLCSGVALKRLRTRLKKLEPAPR
jgi:membrane associated rhomboid family serine protease